MRKSDRFSSRNIELLDVPDMDETVAVGSLSGKLKLQFKAFSRKVARSLSFTNKSASPGSVASSGSSSSTAAAAGSSAAAASPRPQLVSTSAPAAAAAGPASAVQASPRA